MQRQCKCHGVSGSCSIQTCWDQLADFRVVGALLKRKYLDAIRVDYVRGELIDDDATAATLSNGRHSRDDQEGSGSLDFPKRDLVYLERSPDYCSANSTVGTYGTAGRECLRKPRDASDHNGNDMEAWEHRSCKRLCTKCGLQVVKTKIVVESSCNCQFQWCCSVRCDKCKKEMTKFTCSDS
jgi:wingless-type MMTV integration site family protein 8